MALTRLCHGGKRAERRQIQPLSKRDIKAPCVTLNSREGDRPERAILSNPFQVGRGYHVYERYDISIPENTLVHRVQREILRSGNVAGVLPVDTERDEIALIRQYRVGGHLVLNMGSMVEIVAGRVDGNETLEQTAHRECVEELGVAPTALYRLFSFMPAPALLDECMTLFVATIDASRVPPRAGAVHEKEETETIRMPIDAAIEMLNHGLCHSGPTVTALQWLALNRPALPAICKGT
jgi:ADP-ribose pyrophosphatase